MKLPDTPIICGHRGARALAPENTLAGIDLALDLGLPAIEFDVRPTADGVPVLLHDAGLARTFGHERQIGDLTWAQVQALEPRLPSLGQVLEHVAGRSLLTIEIKDFACVPAVLARINAADANDWCIVISFHHAALTPVPRTMRTALVVDPPPEQAPRSMADDLLAALKTVNTTRLSLGYQSISPALLTHLRTAMPEIELWTWTVNEPREALQLASMGIDMIVTDDPPLIGQAFTPAIEAKHG